MWHYLLWTKNVLLSWYSGSIGTQQQVEEKVVENLKGRGNVVRESKKERRESCQEREWARGRERISEVFLFCLISLNDRESCLRPAANFPWVRSTKKRTRLSSRWIFSRKTLLHWNHDHWEFHYCSNLWVRFRVPGFESPTRIILNIYSTQWKVL